MNINKRNRSNYYSDEEDKIPKDPIEIGTDNESSIKQTKPVRDNSNIIRRNKQDTNQNNQMQKKNTNFNQSNPSNILHPTNNNQGQKSPIKNQYNYNTNSYSGSKYPNRLINQGIGQGPISQNDYTSDNNNNNNNFNLNEMRNKIKEQAHRLQNLESYKLICERRIRQLVPNHDFPVNEEDIHSNLNKNNNLKFDENAYLTLLENKEEEISALKCEIEKIKNISFNNSNNNSFRNFNNINYKIPHLEKIPNENIKENYAKLYQQYQEIQIDREQILESLRIETLNNEEQRNYIEILRKTIESSVLKHGLNPIINQQKQNYYNNNSNRNNNNASNLDVIIDICKSNSEAEKAKKDLILSQILITELKQEIEFLHKTNEDLNIKKEKIKENLENGIFELEDSKEKLRNLEADKEEINQCYNELLKNSEKLQEELQSSNEIVGKYEKELHESAKKINDLSTENENNAIIQSKMLEYKKSFEKIYEDFEENLKIKNKFESELIELKEDLEIKRMELNRLKILNEEREMKFEKEKKIMANDTENVLNRNKKAERNLNDIENLLREREKEVLKYQDKYNDCELSNQENRRKFENLELDFIDYRKVNERKIEATEKTVRELMSNNSIIKANLDNLNKEKENLFNEIDALNNNNEILNGNVNDFEIEVDNKTRIYEKLNEEYEKLFKDYTELENERKFIRTERDGLLREIRQLKEFYDKEISEKNLEVNRLNSENTFLKNEVNDNKEKNCEAIEKIQISKNQITDISSKLMKQEFEMKILKEKEEELKRKNEQLNLLTRKYEILNGEKDELIAEIDTKNNRLNDHQKKNNILDSEIQERENEKINLINDIRKYEKDLKNAKEQIENYSNKLEKLNQDYQRENKICGDLTLQNKQISTKAEELANALEITLEDKDHLQKEAKQLIEEIHNTKNSEKDFSQKFQNLKNELQEVKNINYSTHAILKTFCLKFYTYVKDSNKNNLLTKKFGENIQEFFIYLNNFNSQNQINNINNLHNLHNLNSNKEKNFLSTINFMENCTKSICAEMEILFEKFKEISEENKDSAMRLKSLEQNYHNLTLTSEERTVCERKLNQNLFELKEENKSLLEDIRNLESQCEKLVNDFKGVRADLKKKLEENGDLKHEIRENMSSNGKLNVLLKEKEANNSYLNYQILALEDCIKIICKEKKNLEGLISKISKCLPVKEMQKAINEVLCVFDSLGQMERDRSKLEQNLKNLEMQIANSSNNNEGNDFYGNNNNNESISVQWKIQRENLKNEIEEINRKIADKKDEQRKLELELRAIDFNEKRGSDIKYDYNNSKNNLNNNSFDKFEDLNTNTNTNKAFRNYDNKKFNSNHEEFSRTFDTNNNNNNENDYSRMNSLNNFNTAGRFENKMDSYPSQDIPRNDYKFNYNNDNTNQDYQYVGSSGYEDMNLRGNANANHNSNSILRKYKRVGGYFD